MIDTVAMNVVIKPFALRLALISLAVLPLAGIAAEDFDFSIASNSQAQLHVRTLAASCAACHGSNGNALDVSAVLAGMDKHYFISRMLVFKNGDQSATAVPTVMHRHAKGLQLEEINQLADYFSAQKKVPATRPTTQQLKLNHD